MPNLYQALGLEELLDSADVCMPGWGLCHPDLGPLLSLEDVDRASRTGSPTARNEVLLQLALLGREGGAGDREAAAVLCHLLAPGVSAKLGPMRLPVSSNEVDRLAAQHLWIQCRTFPCEAQPKVAPTILWNVRRAVLAELGIEDRVRGDLTWAHTRVFDQSDLEAFAGEPESFPEPGEELAELLERAQADHVITSEQALLLVTLVRVAEHMAIKRVTTHGLLSADVSQQVGQQLGWGASTVRNKVGLTLDALRQATRKAS